MSSPAAPASATPSAGASQFGAAPLPRLWLCFLACGGLAALGYAVVPAGTLRDGLHFLIALVESAAILVGVRLYRPPRHSPWLLMAAGQVLWTVGDTATRWNGDGSQVQRFTVSAGAFHLCAYVVLVVGLSVLHHVRRPSHDISSYLDSGTVSVGLGVLAWVLVAEPALTRYGESPAILVMAVLWPVTDLAFVGIIVAMVTSSDRPTSSQRLLLVALSLLVVADVGSFVLGGAFFSSADALDPLRVTGYVLWGAAALHPSMHDFSTPAALPPSQLNWRLLTALILAVLIAPGVLAVQLRAGVPLDGWAVVIGSVVLFLLVVARMRFAIGQMTAANQARERAQTELVRLAATDSLTGLPNRAQGLRLVEGALGRAQRYGTRVALLFVDLDGFKNVNDTLGHAAGDEVLRTVARRMADEVRVGDMVARLGGDEFIVLLEPLEDESWAVTVADRLVDVIALPLTLGDGQDVVRVGASIGVAIGQDGGSNPDALLHEADIAAYRAKKGGRGRTEVFGQSLREELRRRVEIEAGLADALARDGLVLHYQPILAVDSGAVEGFEALVRWPRRDGSLLPPGDFVPVAEQSELVCELGAWVLHTATRQLAQWSAAWARDDLTVAVNISGRHVARSRIIADVTAALEASGLPPRQLVLEVTETALIDDPAALVRLAELRALGVAIGLDDFGTGYSSISLLEGMPLDILKVDRRFLLDPGASAAKLLQLIVQAGHAFGLRVVAEGVEHDHQLQTLRALGCELAQGYLLGRPVDPAQVAPPLAARSTSEHLTRRHA